MTTIAGYISSQYGPPCEKAENIWSARVKAREALNALKAVPFSINAIQVAVAEATNNELADGDINITRVGLTNRYSLDSAEDDVTLCDAVQAAAESTARRLCGDQATVMPFGYSLDSFFYEEKVWVGEIRPDSFYNGDYMAMARKIFGWSAKVAVSHPTQQKPTEPGKAMP